MTGDADWTFKAYLRERKVTQNIQRDFTRDALEDPLFPESVKWSEVRAYLISKRACPEAIQAGRSVFKQYQRGSRLRFGRPASRGT